MSVQTVVPLPGIDLPGPDGPGAEVAVPSWRLTAGVRMLWRGDGSFQLEHAGGGVVVAGLDRTVAAGLARPPREFGPRGLARREPTPRAEPADLTALYRLAELGYVRAEHRTTRVGTLATAPSGPGAVDDVGGPAGSDVDPRPGSARRLARVDITGLTAVSAYVGALLGAAGVGAVGFTSAGIVRRRHLLPGGLAASDEGRRFGAAAADVVARAAPRTDVAPPIDAEPDLVVVCLDAPMEPELRDLLHRTKRAHLAVHVDAAYGEVGPLVLPGLSACLRCADLHRLDHDPAWSVLAVQLIAQAGVGDPTEPGLAARTGALAAALALRWLDGEPTAGGTLDGSYELRAAGVSPRRRGRRPHPECGCRAAWG